MGKESGQSAVPAVERALNIFEYLGSQEKPMSFNEIASALRIPSVSAFRIVKCLCSRGYLSEDPSLQGRYSLGFQFLHLAHLLSKRSDLSALVMEPMRKLAEKSGQTAQLGILHENGIMYISQALSTKPINIIAALRVVLPINISASGKVLVAFLESKAQEEFLAKVQFSNFTPNSIYERDKFLMELAKVREKGYAIDNEEYARGIGCLAAPIFNYTGENVAAIGITGPISDYHNQDNLELLKRWVLETAEEASERIGYKVKSVI